MSYFFNPTVAAAAFIINHRDEALFVVRAKEPSKGLLGLPGGFIEAGETAEAAVSRETREEVGLEIHDIQYLCSYPNLYPYNNITYPVCDLIFSAQTDTPEQALPLDDTADIIWRKIATVNTQELAFPSVVVGLHTLQQRLRKREHR
jgi:ADP-ribose pyrophosphatase YjhB (NUDIX family)